MLAVKTSPSPNVAEVTASSHTLVCPYVVLTFATLDGLGPGLPEKYAICEDFTPVLSMQLASITCSPTRRRMGRPLDEIELDAMMKETHPQRHILKAGNSLMKQE
jgi:hypothetical protein